PEGDFRFEVGTSATVGNRFSSGPSYNPVNLNVWTHLAFVQQVEAQGIAGRRVLYLNGVETASTAAHPPIYNPAPSQTRIAVMRGSWDHRRTAGFIGQAENIAVFQHALHQNEITSLTSMADMPADHVLKVNIVLSML
ncbi:hypothetical protein FS749_009207, partial [Ceratobasidium sp. UAMH 11750]